MIGMMMGITNLHRKLQLRPKGRRCKEKSSPQVQSVLKKCLYYVRQSLGSDLVGVVSELAMVVTGDAAAAEEYDVTVLRITAQIAQLDEELALPELNITQHEACGRFDVLLLVKFQTFKKS